ncbi:MAG: hypothetical protein HRT95_17650 [Moritella sp.]|uniref:contractile injection system protein, VgrG/Pvc8 family n=1 Tax=Moritella sp. TaxID=78556 RepID=UPI001DA3A6B7|nr:contractile injection system protein, VgrG/Pvc8 family [Moritella sp.]NQZ51926.1 hypothetical protein [Moritella sp.]
MAAATQQHSMMKITTPLGGDALHITAVSMQESISSLYEIHASVYTTNSELDYQLLLGQSTTIELAVKDSSGNYTRNFNGLVTSISSQGQTYHKTDNANKYYCYTLIISPQFWLATMRSNCRIFQDLSVMILLLRYCLNITFSLLTKLAQRLSLMNIAFSIMKLTINF